MFNPRLIFGVVSLFFLLWLIVDYTSMDKKIKFNRSVEVQDLDYDESLLRKITNGALEVYVSLEDGSIRQAFLFEKKERNGLKKTRLMSSDDLLRFYFRTDIDGYDAPPFEIVESSDDYLKISSIDANGNIFHKIFYFEDDNTLLIQDEVEFGSGVVGSIKVDKYFFRNRNKSIDYGTSFSRDHLAYSMTDDVFNDEQLSSVKERENYQGNWIGYSQKHFVVAIFDKNSLQQMYLHPPVEGKDLYRFGFEESATIQNSLLKTETRLFLGPKKKNILENVAPHFEYNLDLGFVYGIGEFFIVVLNFFYSWVGSWGFAIVLLTLLFKVALSPLQIIQLRSMVKMRQLQPKIQEIQERYKSDRNKLGMEMMQLYKKEKFNPFAGCFPLLPQIPIFLAMFWVTREAFEFRGESFLWIPDLAESDPYLITPVLMGLMMFLSQKLMPKPPQSKGMQAQIAQQMMVVFPPLLTLIFIFMPAGVVIYSVINMLLSIIPQAIILNRAVAAENG